MIDVFENIVKKIKDKDNDELREFLVSRIDFLESQTKMENLGFNNGKIVSIYKGYISSLSPIKSSMNSVPFFLDSIDIYLNFIINYRNHINENDLLKMIQDLQSYFISSFGLIGSQKMRNIVAEEYFSDKKSADINLSVYDLTSNGAAMCLERSAILQNILSILGLNCYLIYGKLIRMENNVPSVELHSYNLVQIKKDDYLIFDISNPLSLEFDKEKKYFPAINVIDYCKLSEIINGSNYYFDNEQVEKLFNFKATVLNEIKRIYTIG